MTERERDVLLDLQHLGDWCRPMDVGGRNSSHHSATLRRLVSKGLVERRIRGWMGYSRGAYRYRITAKGVAEINSETGPDNQTKGP